MDGGALGCEVVRRVDSRGTISAATHTFENFVVAAPIEYPRNGLNIAVGFLRFLLLVGQRGLRIGSFHQRRRDRKHFIAPFVAAPIAGEGVSVQQKDHRIESDIFERRGDGKAQIDTGSAPPSQHCRGRSEALRLGGTRRRRIDVVELKVVEQRGPDGTDLSIHLRGAVPEGETSPQGSG
jgi:hypothetical protein